MEGTCLLSGTPVTEVLFVMRRDLLRTLLSGLLTLLLAVCPAICCGAGFDCHDHGAVEEIEPHEHDGHTHKSAVPSEDEDDHSPIRPAHSHVLDCICHGATASPVTTGTQFAGGPARVTPPRSVVPRPAVSGRDDSSAAIDLNGRLLRLRLQTLTL